MQAAFILLRLTSQLLSSVMGGVAVFCLYYVLHLPDYHTVCLLLNYALEYGGGATAIVYFQGRYLDK
jgi:hypothetical protein